MNKIALVVGGSNGLGLSIVQTLLSSKYEQVYILDKVEPYIQFDDKVTYIKHNLLNNDLSVLEKCKNIDTLIITSGFGRVASFETILDQEIINSFKVNAMAVLRIIKFFYSSIMSNKTFYCTVIVSISGLISSPLFSVYAATKAAVFRFIESVNIELEKNGTSNRILNVSPGSLKGTRFTGGENDLTQTRVLADDILQQMFKRVTLYVPDSDVYMKVINQYQSNAYKFGVDSYDYKVNSGRLSCKPQIKIGYLSGTFDLFHIGHLNILRRAKEYCDYLVVGIHKDANHKGKDAFIPFEERKKIVSSIIYVDEVIESFKEDSDAYDLIKYDYLFVGSDYKGTERFIRYEEYFKNKPVEIIYFPYTQGTSSTQLRDLINKFRKG